MDQVFCSLFFWQVWGCRHAGFQGLNGTSVMESALLRSVGCQNSQYHIVEASLPSFYFQTLVSSSSFVYLTDTLCCHLLPSSIHAELFTHQRLSLMGWGGILFCSLLNPGIPHAQGLDVFAGYVNQTIFFLPYWNHCLWNRCTVIDSLTPNKQTKRNLVVSRSSLVSRNQMMTIPTVCKQFFQFGRLEGWPQIHIRSIWDCFQALVRTSGFSDSALLKRYLNHIG